MGKWVCKICGYVYDEAKEGTPFAELPESWVCPLCGAPKSSFAPEAKQEAVKPKAAPLRVEGDMRELSAGELSAVCSNLARGCEKQYTDEEAGLYRELADYFAAATPAVEGDAERLQALMREDLQEGYPALRAAAQAEGDRGTQRICVWGEKVTAIVESLLARYRREGEAFLKGKQVWVCSVCGFVYVGEKAPELCPVCKVPAWKFENVEGRD